MERVDRLCYGVQFEQSAKEEVIYSGICDRERGPAPSMI